MSVKFESEIRMEEAFAVIKEKYINSPAHKELMNSVSDFKVTFGEETEKLINALLYLEKYLYPLLL